VGRVNRRSLNWVQIGLEMNAVASSNGVRELVKQPGLT